LDATVWHATMGNAQLKPRQGRKRRGKAAAEETQQQEQKRRRETSRLPHLRPTAFHSHPPRLDRTLHRIATLTCNAAAAAREGDLARGAREATTQDEGRRHTEGKATKMGTDCVQACDERERNDHVRNPSGRRVVLCLRRTDAAGCHRLLSRTPLPHANNGGPL